MKTLQIVLAFLLVFTSEAKAFDRSDYKEYVQEYLLGSNEIVIRNGVCKDLVLDMFSYIDDKMLVDTSRSIWGKPVLDIEDVERGDIIAFNGHIVVVYDNRDGMIIIADQNRNGDSSGVNIYEMRDNYKGVKYRIFRPITLSEISIYNDGENYTKDFCLRLFTIHVADTEKMSRSSFDLDYDPDLRSYILDPDLEYNQLEFNYAMHFNGKVYCSDIYSKDGKVGCYIKIPFGKLVINQTQFNYWKPIRIDSNRN